MPLLHDAATRESIKARIKSLTPDSKRKWGAMEVDQMLWHINMVLKNHLGKISVPAHNPPIPKPVMRFIVLNMPWPKSPPTNPAFVASARYDFESQRAELLTLLDEFAAKDMSSDWPEHATFGKLTGKQVSKLQAKHLNHHLTQFGV